MINYQSIRSKKAEILNLLLSSNLDIVLGTETWLRPDMYTAEIFPPNFSVFRKDRPDGHGGVLVATKTNSIAHEVSHNTAAEAVYVKIKTQGQSRPLVVGAIYRTPSDNSLEHIQEITTSLNTLDTNDIIWVGGDLNLPDIDWKANQVVGHQYPNLTNQTFLSKITDMGLHQVNDKPTKVNATLDILCTHHPSLVTKTAVIPGLSDHDIVLVYSRIIKSNKTKPTARNISIWKQADFEAIRSETAAFSEDFTSNPPDTAEDQWQAIRSHLHSMMEKHVPTKTCSTKHHQPWINAQ